MICKKNRLINVLFSIGVVLLVVLLFVILGKKESKWVQDGNVITKGNQTLNIGDIYDYDETNSGEVESLTDVNWKVMGVDEEGNLLIMSTMDVTDVTLGEKDNLELSQNDYVEGVNKLNEIAALYGKGKGSIGARSITVEDVNKITNYNYSEYAKGTVGQYNNEVTYYWTDSEKPMYKGNNGVTGNLSNKHNDVFVWYDEQEKEWETNKKQETTESNPIEITTLKSNFYAYDNTTLDPNDADNMISILDTNSNEYKMLFEDEDGNRANYWLATPFVNTPQQFAAYGYLAVKGEDVNYTYLVYSMGVSRGYTAGLRVVVTID